MFRGKTAGALAVIFVKTLPLERDLAAEESDNVMDDTRALRLPRFRFCRCILWSSCDERQSYVEGECLLHPGPRLF